MNNRLLVLSIMLMLLSSFLSQNIYGHSEAIHENLATRAMGRADNKWGSSWLDQQYVDEIYAGSWQEDWRPPDHESDFPDWFGYFCRTKNHAYNPIMDSTGGIFASFYTTQWPECPGLPQTAKEYSAVLWQQMLAAQTLTGGDGTGAYHYLGRCCHLLQDMSTYVHVCFEDVGKLEHKNFEGDEVGIFSNWNWSPTYPPLLPTDPLPSEATLKLDTWSASRLTNKASVDIQSFIDLVARITYFRSTFWGEVQFVEEYNAWDGPSDGEAAPSNTTATNFGGVNVSSKPNVLRTMFGSGNVRYRGTFTDDYFEIIDAGGQHSYWQSWDHDDTWFPCWGSTPDGHVHVGGADPTDVGVYTTGRFHFTRPYNVVPQNYPDGSTFDKSSLGYYISWYSMQVGVQYNAGLIGVGSAALGNAPFFNITASAGSHGSIDPLGNVFVNKGDSKAFNALPDSGYEVLEWRLDGSVVQSGGNSYIVANVQSDRSLSVTFTQQSNPGSTTKTLTATEYANVWSAIPNYNGVNNSSITVFWNDPSSGDAYGLLKFNLSSIPNGSTVDTVRLELNCARDDGNLQIAIFDCGNNWSSSSVNWTNKPSFGGFVVFTYSSGVGKWTWQSTKFDNIVQGWIDSTNYGLYIIANNSGGLAHFSSGLSLVPVNLRPKLVVSYTPPPPPDLIITNLYPSPAPSSGTFYVGENIAWYVTVRNNSGGPAGSSRVGYYLGTSSADLSNPINSDPTGALDNGDSETDNASYTFSDSDIGQRFLICKADYDGNVDESNENNNTRVYGPFNVAPPIVYYTLTTSVTGGHGTISPSPGGTHKNGEVITLTATPDIGYKVKSWSGTDNDSSTATANTVTMTSYKTVTVEFEPISRSISGYVRTSGGLGISGVMMTGWPGAAPVTDSSGYYHGTVSDGWSGTIIPSKNGYTFSPTSTTYSNVTSDKSNENYIGSMPRTISGYVRTSGGLGISGVMMTGWPGAAPVTDSSGYYSGTVSDGWSGTIIPSKAGYTFSPTSTTYSNVASDKSNENYIGYSKPTVSIIASTPNAGEPANNGDFKVERIGITTGNLRVYYSFSGSTATSGSDYAALAGYVDFLDGQISANITIVVKDDNDEEGSEVVKVTIISNTAYDVDPSLNSASVTIADDEGAPPNISGYIPKKYSIQAAIDTIIQLHITDSDIGVEYESVTIHVEGDLIYDGAEESSEGVYDSTGKAQTVKGICRRIGTDADYTFVFQPSTPFDYEQKVDVAVSATDKADNDITETYYFYTVMRSFGKNVKVNSDTGTFAQNHPDSAIDSSGNIWVVWEHTVITGDSDIYIGKLPKGGSAFESSQLVFSDPNDQRKPAIAIDGDEIYVAWQGDDPNGLWDIYVSTSINGTDWSNPVKVNSDDPHNKSNQTTPAIGIDGNGKAYIAWEDNSKGDSDKDIWAATSSNAATWTSTLIASAANNQTEPSISIDLSDDTAYIFWTDARNASTDIYAAKFTSSWSTNPLVETNSNQWSPVGATSIGDIHLLWVDDYNGYDDIFYGKDGSNLPIADGTSIVDEPETFQSSPSMSIAVNDTKVYACWQDSRNVSSNADTDIYYTMKGDSGFGTNILVNDDIGTFAQTSPVIGTDIDGNPFIVWVDNREGNNDIYGTTITSTGSILRSTTVNALFPTVQIVQINENSDNIDDADDVTIEIPGGALPVSTQIKIAKLNNPPDPPVGAFGVFYEFSPSGLEFLKPVTITIPHKAVDCPGHSEYRVYFYDPSILPPASPWSREGITNVQHVTDLQDPSLPSGVHIIRFNTTHFTAFGVGGGASVAAGGGGGGGGGCSVSAGGEGNIVEFLLPYIGFIIVLVILTVRDARVRKASGR